jgi:hypothetical protein
VQEVDIKKELKHLYQASSKEVVEVDVPAMAYLMLDGEGDPNTSQEYADAVEALFSVSYTAKFAVKKGPLAIDYGVMPLEGLWWADDMSTFSCSDKSNWKWTMMIMQPELVTHQTIQEAIASVEKKKPSLSALANLRVELFSEGRCAQLMHIGPFSEEGPTIERVHQFISEQGRLSGKHHEIYLSDIRRAHPSKWKTIIRQPMQ